MTEKESLCGELDAAQAKTVLFKGIRRSKIATKG